MHQGIEHQGSEVERSDHGGRNFTDADIDRLAEVLADKHHRTCRFPTVEPAELSESIKFYRNLNKFFDESKHTIWRTFLTTGVGALLLIIALGIIAKLKESIGP